MDDYGLFATECNSGYESGWTNYLDHSILSANPSSNDFKDSNDRGNKEEVVEEEEEEEDLSMISDASSGPPPHFFYEINGCFNDDDDHDDDQYHYPLPQVAALDKNGAKQQVPPSCLDDTATSSPLINFFKTYDEVSMESIFDYPLQGLSATHLMGGPTFRDHCGFYQYSLYGNQLQTNHWF
ncbi:hypothetical protein ES332_A03G216700v1 [Gossypium tomentosum]|uniref:Uncharacterized protein n=1 Tax=Gossypium tomentosum TaxID=34277 RepID=A0A5D2RAJ7_GOSTO|nr:hypothetical protein ES332_A03G216700v1 [Gossypium tomentosum]